MIVARQHIPLTVGGSCCQTPDLWRRLLSAAARRSTIEAVGADLPGAPDAKTVRGYLSEQLPVAALGELEQQWNNLLASLIPHWLRHRPQAIAVDCHDQP